MAEDLADSSQNNGEMLELSICQPDHPNQAVFLPELNISLQEFRTKITESSLVLPERWLFMTRSGSLIPADQEENLQLNTIARAREESAALDVLITPTRFCQRRGNGAHAGNSPLASFATIVGALRDIYVTSIQPNLHELMKPLIIAAIVSAVLAFILATGLALSLGALGGLSRSALSPFFRLNLCRDEMDTAAEIPRLYKRIQELESRISHMRQVEVGTLTCREDNHMYEETQSSVISVPFRKTKFSDAPRVTFALREVSVDDPHSVRLEDVKVNSTGFSARCSYFGKWMHYNIQYTWTAVGN